VVAVREERNLNFAEELSKIAERRASHHKLCEADGKRHPHWETKPMPVQSHICENEFDVLAAGARHAGIQESKNICGTFHFNCIKFLFRRTGAMAEMSQI